MNAVPTPPLRRELGLRDLVLFNIATVVGIRWLAAAAHTGPGSITLWVAAALLFFVPSAVAIATLSSRFPEEGGIYCWTRREFGGWHGFLCGWCYWLSNLFYFPNLLLAGVGIAAFALGLAESKFYAVATSLLILWVVLLTNLVGLSVGKWINNVGGVATYAAGALLILMGALVWSRSGSVTPIRVLPEWHFEKLNFWSQIAFAFGGLELGSVMGGEIREPSRTVARAAWLSAATITALYVFGTLAILVLLTPDRVNVLTGLVQAADIAGERLGARWASRLLVALVLLGVTGQLGAWIGGSARVPFVIGLDRHLPVAFARLHPRWRTPHVAILTEGIACTVFLLVLQAGENLRSGYQLLVDMTVITYFIPFLYLFGASCRQGQRRSASVGLLVTSLAIVLSLIPPSEATSIWRFELKLLGGCAVLIACGWLVFRRGARSISSIV